MKKTIIAIALISAALTSYSQDKPKLPYQFTDVKTVEVTSIKNQAVSGTCWCFSAVAQLESEILISKKDTVDLSEMYIVRHAYYEKAIKYARLHGHINFAQGGQFHDVINMIDKYGIVPESEYAGLNYGSKTHNHQEISSVLTKYMDAIISGKVLSTAWQKGLEGILDAYFGPVPEKFTYNGKEYTPKEFAKWLGIEKKDYINVTSFNHHPFYEAFPLEIEDNWAWAASQNVPVDKMIELIDKTLDDGHTVAWGSDVSEGGFKPRQGFAVYPETEVENMSGSDKEKWVGVDKDKRQKTILNFETIVPEKTVTQESRQKDFDNYKTTDDHGMLIVGYATDQEGHRFYKVKNSWGEIGEFHGYFYVSVPFVKAKTTDIQVPTKEYKKLFK